MLSIATSGAARGGFCDRLPRRDLLRAGTLLGLGGACGDLSLPRLLAAEAAAGGGRAVTLPRDASLIAEIAGLTLAERYRAEFDVFFAEWMLLCR